MIRHAIHTEQLANRNPPYVLLEDKRAGLAPSGNTPASAVLSRQPAGSRTQPSNAFTHGQLLLSDTPSVTSSYLSVLITYRTKKKVFRLTLLLRNRPVSRRGY